MPDSGFAVRNLGSSTALVYRHPLVRDERGFPDFSRIHQTCHAKLGPLIADLRKHTTYAAAFMPDDPMNASNKNAYFEVGYLLHEDGVPAVRQALEKATGKPAREAKQGEPEGFALRTLNPGLWATLLHTGGYASLGEAYPAAFRKLAEADYETDSTGERTFGYEVYLLMASADDEEGIKAEVEICLPVKRKAA